MTAEPDLERDSARAGIIRGYRDAWGKARSVPDATVERLLRALHLPPGDRATHPAEGAGHAAACYRPAWMNAGQRLWGVAVQLYGIRSRLNWGIGDFSDLLHAIERAAAAGADFVVVNPLHALFAAEPRHFSPYSPSSREFLNVLYIDVTAMTMAAEAVGDLLTAADFQRSLAAVRDAELVDYPAVAALKETVFRIMFERFEAACDEQPDRDDVRDFAAFLVERGEPLRHFAIYQALSSWPGFGTDWRRWPAEFRDPHGADVAAFAEAEMRELRYHAFLQWEADRQLARCAEATRAAGMRIGLCADLPVGTSLASAEGWAEQRNIILGFHVGAPPDPWNELGQDWGLAAYNPTVTAQNGYAAFRRILRANMRHVGAIRIDHILGFNRLFLVPEGGKPVDGAYLRLSERDLCAVLAEESVAHGCVVVGEDLGTVPDGMRQVLQENSILSYRLLIFAAEGGRFLQPAEYPREALVAISTHDLPTFLGYWSGRDIALKSELRQYPDEGERIKAEAQREADRQGLIAAFRAAGIDPGASPLEVLRAAYRFLGRTPSALLAAQLEDLALEANQPNLPGTTDEYPNWRRKLARDLDAIFGDPQAAPLLEALRSVRPR